MLMQYSPKHALHFIYGIPKAIGIEQSEYIIIKS